MQPSSTTPTGERWNVNMPAVIGVVFVFLVVVIVWVVVASGDDEAVDSTITPAATTQPSNSPATSEAGTATSVPPTTSPTPLPDTTPSTVATSTTPASSPTTVPATTEPSGPPTTAAGAVDGAVPGDLAVPGFPMLQPPCDGSFITILASAIGDQATAAGVGAVLDDYPGSNYLRTDQSCRSLRPDVDGEPIYVVYFGPFPFESDACIARVDGPPDAYARQMSNDIGPDQSVDCGDDT